MNFDKEANPGTPAMIWHQMILLFGARRSLMALAIAILVCFLPVILPSITYWFELSLIDLTQKIGMYLRSPDPNIIVVAIDAETLDGVKNRWPWPRSEFARLFEAIEKGKPRFIISDIFFQHSEETPGQEGDEQLEFTLRKYGNIGLVSIVEEMYTGSGLQLRHYRNLKRFRDAAALEGFVWCIVESDGGVRDFVVRDNRLISESCVFQTAKKLNPAISTITSHIEPSLVSQIAFACKGGGIPYIRAGDIMSGAVSPSILENKVALLGVTADVLKDYHQTALGFLSGVEILAATFDTISQRRVVIPKSDMFWRTLSTLMGLTTAVLIFYLSGNRFLLISLIAIGAILSGGLYLSQMIGLYPPWAIFIFSWLISTTVLYGITYFLNFLAVQSMRNEAVGVGKVQAQFFPGKPWSSGNGYICKGVCFPCETAGGDFFDIVHLSDGSLVFMIADVTGHGFGAAMITSIIKSLVVFFNREGKLSIMDLISSLNLVVMEIFDRHVMVTLMIGHLQPKQHKISVGAVGHLPALLVKQDGTCEEIGLPCFPIGKTEKLRCQFQEFDFPPGASLILYTDGIVEALDWKNKQYSLERWWKWLSQQLPKFDPDMDLKSLLSDVYEHTQGRVLSDDATLLILTRRDA